LILNIPDEFQLTRDGVKKVFVSAPQPTETPISSVNRAQAISLLLPHIAYVLMVNIPLNRQTPNQVKSNQIVRERDKHTFNCKLFNKVEPSQLRVIVAPLKSAFKWHSQVWIVKIELNLLGEVFGKNVTVMIGTYDKSPLEY
jgi:hypothetical protein